MDGVTGAADAVQHIKGSDVGQFEDMSTHVVIRPEQNKSG
jgi:hypothetical protein